MHILVANLTAIIPNESSCRLFWPNSEHHFSSKSHKTLTCISSHAFDCPNVNNVSNKEISQQCFRCANDRESDECVRQFNNSINIHLKCWQHTIAYFKVLSIALKATDSFRMKTRCFLPLIQSLNNRSLSVNLYCEYWMFASGHSSCWAIL